MILFKILIFFVVFCLIFHLLTKKYLNPYKLIMVFGKKGAGKTTFLTKIAIKEYRAGKKVYSTIPIPGTEIFSSDQIGFRDFEENSVILIDEVSLIWDNRQWKSLKPEVIEFFRLQRHSKLRIYMFSQSFDVDKKIRDLCDQMYLLRNTLRVWSIARKINKRVTVSTPSQDENGNEKNGALVEDYSFCPLLMPDSMIVTFIPRWTVFFDSYEIAPKDKIDTYAVPFNGEQYNCIEKKGYIRYVFIRLRKSIFNWFAKRFKKKKTGE